MIGFTCGWLLLLLPLPLLVWLWTKPAKNLQTGAVLKIPFFSRLKILANSTAIKEFRHLNKSRWTLALIIWGLLVIAAAGPNWIGAPIYLNQSGRNIMLLIDLSGSMEIADMVDNDNRERRISAVKQVATSFIQQRVGDRLGLILFGTRAYLQTPLTFDRQTVQAMLNDATVGLAGEQTAIGDAIGLAVKRLLDVPPKSRVIILLTDGASNAGVLSPTQAAQLAAAEGIKIYTIGIGSGQIEVPTFFGPQVINTSSDLDVNTLRDIASITGGTFFRAKDTAALQQAYRTLDQLEPVAAKKSVFRPKKSLFQWPLALAFLVSVCIAISHIQWQPRRISVAEEMQ